MARELLLCPHSRDGGGVIWTGSERQHTTSLSDNRRTKKPGEFRRVVMLEDGNRWKQDWKVPASE